MDSALCGSCDCRNGSGFVERQTDPKGDRTMNRYSTLRRTGFKRKTFEQAQDEHPSPRCFGLNREKGLKPGKKTKAWDRERRKLKIESERTGLTTCELRGVIPHECSYNNFLGYAHDAKRRKLSAEDLKRAILICNNVHDIIEAWPAEEMKQIVNDTIAARSEAAYS